MHEEEIERLYQWNRSLEERLDIMAAAQGDQQAQLDALTARVEALDTVIQTTTTEVEALKAQPGAAQLDFSGVDAALTKTEGDAATAAADGAPAQPAVPAAPSDGSVAPVPDPTQVASTSPTDPNAPPSPVAPDAAPTDPNNPAAPVDPASVPAAPAGDTGVGSEVPPPTQ